MTINADLLGYIIYGGPTVFLLVVILLLIQDPDRAEKLKALILKPAFRFFRWGSRSYMAAEVGSKTTEFFKRFVCTYMPSAGQFKVKIKWVRSPSDPVLQEDGTLILRIRETDDQTFNVLAATRIALPQVVCPTLRGNIQRHAEVAIDLTLLRSLAEKLGRHVRPLFQRQFLAPEIEADPRVARLFERLVQLDDEKIFVPIFLEECSLVADSIYGAGSIKDVTDEVVDFLEFLLTLVNREIGELIPLDFHTRHFHLAMLLLAKTIKAETVGVRPYLNRVDRDVRVGCDSVYLIAFPPAKSFLSRILAALEADQRLTLIKRLIISKPSPFLAGRSGIAEIALLRVNRVFGESTFQDKLTTLGIVEGSLVEGTALDVSEDWALVDVRGLNAFIRKSECSWFTDDTCSSVLEPRKIVRFLAKSINIDRQCLELSLKFQEDDPWKTMPIPKVGDKVQVKLRSMTPSQFIGVIGGLLEVRIPYEEFSWTAEAPDRPQDQISQTVNAVIYERSDEDRRLMASPRRIEQDPWPQIHRRFPKESEFQARIVEVTPYFARVALPGGLTGTVPKEQFEMAGYEYAKHEENLIVGQLLHVVVTKVFIKRQKIRLALKRNVDGLQSGRHVT